MRRLLPRQRRRGSFASIYHCIDSANEFRSQAGRLFGGEGEGLLGVLDHLTHFADALGALGRALIGRENIARPSRARFDGLSDVTLAKAVTVADVQGGTAPKQLLRMVRYSIF
jgi:hypothetical protein